MNSIVQFARREGHPLPGSGLSRQLGGLLRAGHHFSIDPERNDLLFERFVSMERREPPDIDVDFEAERREEVIQWIYETYGRDRAALCATVMRFRARGAVQGRRQGAGSDGGRHRRARQPGLGLVAKKGWRPNTQPSST